MKKLIITFTILAVVFLLARLLFGYYVDTVSVFSVLLTPLTWLTAIFGGVAVVLIVIVIIKEISKK